MICVFRACSLKPQEKSFAVAKPPGSSILPISPITQKIYILRKTRVMLDSDLALLYGVTTKNLNRAVKRNKDRFPSDFLFQLTASEKIHGGRRYAKRLH
jgi:ORF6N domain